MVSVRTLWGAMVLEKLRELFQPSVLSMRVTKRPGGEGELSYTFNELTADRVGIGEFLTLIDGGDFLLDIGFGLQVSNHRLTLVEPNSPLDPATYFDFSGPKVVLVVQDFREREPFWDAIAGEVDSRSQAALSR